MIVIVYLISILCLFGLLVGIIEPSLVIRWGDIKKATREKVFIYYGIGLTLLLVFSLNFCQTKSDKITLISLPLMLICLFCLICLIIGIKHPSLVIRWKYNSEENRELVFKHYGIGLVFSAFIFNLFAPTKIDKIACFTISVLLVFLIFLSCLIIGMIKPNLVIRWRDVKKVTRTEVFKYYGIGSIITVFIFISGTLLYDFENKVINAKNEIIQNEQAKKAKEAEEDKKAKEQEIEKQKQEIKSLQEKYKPLLESGKSYQNMTDEEGKIANELISNWSKLEKEFKTSYQAQKDSISKSIDEYNAKKKAEQEAQKEAEEKASYNTGITYKQLARTPEDYYGKKVKFTGKVVQVMDRGSETDLRIEINGDYDSVLFATYKSSISSVRILENDNVTVYGIYTGIKNYKTILGASISIPGMSIDKIELNN